MIEPPRRQDPPPRCRCILTPPDEIAALMFNANPNKSNRCRENVTPDSPYCHECEDGHPDYLARGFKVTAVPLVDR